jgi:hypothetical protein
MSPGMNGQRLNTVAACGSSSAPSVGCGSFRTKMNVADNLKVIKEFVPGALYCTFVSEIDGCTGEWEDREGPFVYWTGGQFVTEDGDDADHFDWDFLVRQGDRVNPSMIEN